MSAILMASLMGSLSANAAVILEDHFTVTGGANADINAEWNTRQTGTSLSPYTPVGVGTASVVNDFGNGGTAKVEGTLNDGDFIGLVQNNWIAGLNGNEWEMSFFSTTTVDANFTGGWFGFGVSTDVHPNNSVFGKFGMLHRADNSIAVFIDGAYVDSYATGFNPVTSILHYKISVDEVANTMDFSFDAYDATLAHLGSATVLTDQAIDFSGEGSNRGFDFRIHADTAAAAAGSFLVDDLVVETIPEPATFGLVAAFGGAMVFLRKKIMI